MRIKIGLKNYTQIKSLSFDPQTDVTGSEVVVNQFSAQVITQDNLDAGTDVYLYDDEDNLWAKYWLIEAIRFDYETVSVLAQSKILLLGRTTLPAVMYSGASVASVLSAVFANFDSGEYSIDPSFSEQTISGFCKEQTARERLQWVCFVIGAYIKTYFNDKIEILPIDEEQSDIPLNRTFWKPSINYGDYVTAIRVRAYTFTRGTPQTTDEWVTDGTNYYIQTTQDFTLSNPEASATMPENVIAVEDVTLVSGDNVSNILSNLSTYYFKRIEVSLDAINNAEYEPGDFVTCYTDEKIIVEGYVKSASFTFGLQARATLTIMQTDVVASSQLVIQYVYSGMLIGAHSYNLPTGYKYSIENPYIDLTQSGVRRVYRPNNKAASGTVEDGGTVDRQPYGIALEFSGGTLRINSVDEVEQKDAKVVIE